MMTQFTNSRGEYLTLGQALVRGVVYTVGYALGISLAAAMFYATTVLFFCM